MNFFTSLNKFFGIDGPTLQDLQKVEDDRHVRVIDHAIEQERCFKYTVGEQGGEYCKAFRTAAFVVLRKYILQGDKFIYLQSLYNDLGATGKAECNPILAVIDRAKKQHYIKSTDQQGVYEVIRWK